MGFDEFCKKCFNLAQQKTVEQYGEEKLMLIDNNVYGGKCIMLKTVERCAPTINIYALWEEFRRGELRTVNDAADEVVRVLTCEQSIPEEVTELLRDIETGRVNKSHVVGKLCNPANFLNLGNVVHRGFLDLIIVPYLEWGDQYKVALTQQMLAYLDWSESEVFDAVEKDIGDYVIQNISVILQGFGICIEDEIPMMYLGHKNERGFGAVVMTNKTALHEAAKAMKCEKIIILPSSVFEVLLVPEDLGLQAANDMVRQCNDEVLSYKDILSGHAYVFDAATDSFSQ